MESLLFGAGTTTQRWCSFAPSWILTRESRNSNALTRLRQGLHSARRFCSTVTGYALPKATMHVGCLAPRLSELLSVNMLTSCDRTMAHAPAVKPTNVSSW